DNLDVGKVAICWRRLRRNAQRWEWNKGPVVSASCSRDNVRIIGARGQADCGRCLAGALPRHTCFRVTALCNVNQLGAIVGLARIDRRQVALFSFSRLVLAKFSFISWKRWWRPRPHWRWRRIIAGKCDPERREQLCRSDEGNLHDNPSNLATAFHEDS